MAGAKRKATGGGISGTDTVPALLTPGEFVVNKKSAQRIGYGALGDINKGRAQGFASGGIVHRFANGSDGPVGPGGGTSIFNILVKAVQNLTKALQINTKKKIEMPKDWEGRPYDRPTEAAPGWDMEPDTAAQRVGPDYSLGKASTIPTNHPAHSSRAGTGTSDPDATLWADEEGAYHGGRSGKDISKAERKKMARDELNRRKQEKAQGPETRSNYEIARQHGFSPKESVELAGDTSISI